MSEGIGTAKEESYKIVHISDLHFGGECDAELWDYVKGYVRGQKPQLIIVSGDLTETPSPLLLMQAKREVAQLANESGSKLFIIPGNHDIAVKGNFHFPYLSRLFWRWFKNDTGTIEAGIPPTPWLVNRKSRPVDRSFARIRSIVGWARTQVQTAWEARKQKLAFPSAAETQAPLLDGPVFVMPFDSNSSIWLATGYVDRGDIYAASGELERRIRERDPAFTYALRIAVVHHHPVPIPFAIVKEGLLSFEPFLVFRNAGEFLRLLSDHSFDLVLHGHQHYYNFTRIALGSEEQKTEMGILSAGSATIGYDTAGRNSFNVITVAPNGRVTITPHFLGGGKVVDEDNLKSFPLRSIEAVKLRNYKRAVKLHEIDRDEVLLHLTVDEFGTQRMDYEVKRLRASGMYSCNHRSFETAVSVGTLVKASLALDGGSSDAGVRLEPAGAETEQEIKRRIVFSREITGSSKSVSYRLSWRVHNVVVMTNWEAEQLGRNPSGSLYFSVSLPARQIGLTLQLPDELRDLRPYVECLIPAGYPNLPLDHEREAVVQGAHTVDTEMTEFESGALRSSAPGTWNLTIDYPLVGYQYAIRWNVASRFGQGASPQTAGEVRAFRNVLLRYGEKRRAGGPANRVTNILQIFLDDLQSRHRAPDPTEEVALSLMVYDEAQHRLRLVDIIQTGSRPIDWNFSLQLGDGVGGAAFKQRRTLMYAFRQLRELPGGDAYRGPEQGGDGFPYEVLLCTPVFHPRERDVALDRRGALPDDTIGVISFGSTSPASGLLKLVNEAERRKFWGISQLVFEAILDALLSQVVPGSRIEDGDKHEG